MVVLDCNCLEFGGGGPLFVHLLSLSQTVLVITSQTSVPRASTVLPATWLSEPLLYTGKGVGHQIGFTAHFHGISASGYNTSAPL